MVRGERRAIVMANQFMPMIGTPMGSQLVFKLSLNGFIK